jgi:hypothetical protein
MNVPFFICDASCWIAQRFSVSLKVPTKVPTKTGLSKFFMGRHKTKNPLSYEDERVFVKLGDTFAVLWWRRRELNPRPEALYRQFYILSAAI